MEKDEIQTAAGSIFTHWDCPSCSNVNEAEGDVDGETLECADCTEQSIIRRI